MMPKFNTAFWKWFGKSKVVDAGGSPLVVYHGTNESFFRFALPGQAREPRHPSSYLGIFFSASPAIAQYFSYDDGSERIIPAYLSIQNPYKLKWSEFRKTFVANYDKDAEWVQARVEGFLSTLVQDGYDGVFIQKSERAKAAEAKADTWAVFEPTQIKSATGNDGTWDSDDPDIRSNPGLEIEAERILKGLIK